MRSFFYPILFCLGCISCTSSKDLKILIEKALEEGKSEIVVPDGTYTLNSTITLQGLEEFSIKAETQGQVVLTSGLELNLSDFTCLDPEQGLYEISLPQLIAPPWPDAFRGTAGWPEVYLNDEPLHLARWPNEGYEKVEMFTRRGSIPRNDDSTNQGGAFISKSLTSTLENRTPNIYLSGYWCYQWYDETLRVAHIDTTTGEIELAAPHRYGMGGPAGGLFYALNCQEFLDEEMEYFYDRENGTIRMILPKESPSDLRIHIAFQDFPLFQIKDCKELTIEGLSFKYTNGWALQISDSDSVCLENCEIKCLGRSGVEITGGSFCGLDSCMLEHIGGLGVSLSGGDRLRLQAANHFVAHSQIRHFARHVKTYAPAVKLDGVGHWIRGNQISDAPHNAILFAGNDHVIEHNDIQRVCLNTSDAGAIYCGRDWTLGGTRIQNNYFKDLGNALHHFNWAIYLDDLASGIDVLHNRIENCPSAILVGGGRYNRIIGNTIINCPRASIMYDARGLNWYIPYLQDPDNEIWQRLWAMPLGESPWKDRFPWLTAIPNDDPGIPKMVTISDNILKNSAAWDLHPSVLKYGKVK